MDFFSTWSTVQFPTSIAIALFAIGVFGFLIRRSGIVALMCVELMLNGVNLMLVTFSHLHGNAEGTALFLFIVLVAAAEAAIALSLLVTLFRKIGTISLDDLRALKG